MTTFYGPIRFNAHGLNTAKPMVVVQIQSGKVVTVWPNDVASAKAIYPSPLWTAHR